MQVPLLLLLALAMLGKEVVASDDSKHFLRRQATQNDHDEESFWERLLQAESSMVAPPSPQPPSPRPPTGPVEPTEAPPTGSPPTDSPASPPTFPMMMQCENPGLTTDCDDGNRCTDDICDIETAECINTPKICPDTEVCDPTTGECIEAEALVPCIAVIDEWSNIARTQQAKWENFRTEYPKRPFCLLRPSPQSMFRTP